MLHTAHGNSHHIEQILDLKTNLYTHNYPPELDGSDEEHRNCGKTGLLACLLCACWVLAMCLLLACCVLAECLLRACCVLAACLLCPCCILAVCLLRAQTSILVYLLSCIIANLHTCIIFAILYFQNLYTCIVYFSENTVQLITWIWLDGVLSYVCTCIICIILQLHIAWSA